MNQSLELEVLASDPPPGNISHLIPDSGGSALQTRFTRHRISWCLACIALLFSIFSIWYVNTVLISGNPVPKALTLSPGTTSLTVQIIAHLIAFLLWQLFRDATQSLRWTLASRDVGVPIPTFLALSQATPISGVVSLFSLWGPHWIWGIQMSFYS
jgi:hypothetical protein